MMRAEVTDENGYHQEVYEPEEQRVQLERSQAHHERCVSRGGGIQARREQGGPERAGPLPAERSADDQEGEVRDERTRGGVGEETEDCERHQVEGVLGDAPPGGESHGCPDQRQNQQAVNQVPAQRVRNRPVARRIGRADRNSQQRPCRQDDPTAGDQPFEANARRILGDDVRSRSVPRQSGRVLDAAGEFGAQAGGQCTYALRGTRPQSDGSVLFHASASPAVEAGTKPG